MIYRNLVRIQFFAVLAAYAALAYKLWTKVYDPRYCSDILLFNRISFFWFIHLTLFGAVIIFSFFCLRKIKPGHIIFSEIVIILGILLILFSFELVLRIRPELLPLDMLMGDLGFKDTDRVVVNKLRYTVVDKHNDDPELAFIYKPNLAFEIKTPEFSYFFRTDKFGFQNFYDETLYDKADIVTVGDSFTEGIGVSSEFSYPRQLSQILNARILNLGQGGYDCYQFPIVLKRFGLKAHPKIVIMSIFSWNDIQHRFFLWEKYRWVNGYVSYEEFVDIKEKFYEYLKTHKNFPLEMFTGSMAKRIGQSLTVGQALSSKRNKKNRLYMFVYLKYCISQAKDLFLKYEALWDYGPYRGIRVNGKALHFPMNDGVSYSSEGLSVLSEYLRIHLGEFRELSEEYNFIPIVLFFPQKQVVYNYFLKNKLIPQLDADATDKAIIDTIKESNLEIINMTPFFVDSIRSGVLPYHLCDDHLNKAGYTITAKALADYLKKYHNFLYK